MYVCMYVCMYHIITVSTDDDVTSYTVTGLESGQRYSFTVRANNSVGEGGASNSVTVSTFEG